MLKKEDIAYARLFKSPNDIETYEYLQEQIEKFCKENGISKSQLMEFLNQK